MRLALLILGLLLATCVDVAFGLTPRTLCAFDFEERDRGNVEDTPVGWQKIEGSGLPRYIKGRFDETIAASGRTSYRLDLNGGSLRYRYPAGAIAVSPNAVCRLSVRIRTTSLLNARAVMTAWFADIDGRPIEGSRRTTTPHTNQLGDTTFHTLGFDMPAAPPNAVSMALEMALLQPALLAAGASAGRPLYVEDINGTAWFDDIQIAQVPQVELWTDQQTNIFQDDEPIALRVRVQDTLVDDLLAEVRVTDVDGRNVFQRTGALARAGTRGESEVRGAIALPALPAGWYRATMSVRSKTQVIGEHAISFVKLVPNAEPIRPDARLGLSATMLPPRDWGMLPDLSERLATGRLKLAVWTRDYAAETDASGVLDRVLDRLARRNVAITACLVAPPPMVGEWTSGDRWSDFANVDNARWQPMLAYLASRFGTGTTTWQFGDDTEAESYARDEPARAAYARLADVMSTFTGSRDLLLPWPAWLDLQTASDAAPAASLHVPSTVLPQQIPLYIDELRSRQQRSIAVSIQPISADRYGRRAQDRDLALRLVHAIAAGADRIDLPLPLEVSDGLGEARQAMPTPLAPALRTLYATLSNARYVGRTAIGEDVDAFCFSRDGKGLLFIARRGDPAAMNLPVRHFDLTLGGTPARLELDGRTSLLPRSDAPGHADDVTLAVDAMPFFVTDVDLPLVMLRASIGFDRPILESSSQPHRRTLTFRNDFDQTISGTIRLIGPNGWTVSLSGSTFNLSPGETFTAPVTITFPTSVPAGATALIADVRIQGRQDRRLLLPVGLRVGLADVGLETFAVRVGTEVIVQQVITNYGNGPIQYTAFVSVPGLARQERIVSGLAAGKTTIRKYRFAAPAEGVQACRSGLKEIDGRRMLNAEVPID